MENIISEPIIFDPILKKVIWGGTKISQYKQIGLSDDKIGESWEISGMEGQVSVVASGAYAGLSLHDLISRFGPQLLGSKVMERYGTEFPILVKLIDATDDLSMQVHPGTDLARDRHGCRGKTEMWYVIAADSGSAVKVGLRQPITPDQYETLVANGHFADMVTTHPTHPGDVFFLPPGTVHAIGSGNLLVEIQEASDITYRIDDYGRLDANGHRRELHTSMAKDAIDYATRTDYRQPSPSSDADDAQLIRCSYFSVRRIRVHGCQNIPMGHEAFSVIVCVDGSLDLLSDHGNVTNLSRGQSALIPAAAISLEARGKATILLVRP
ncbi:MAG: hypothetical protein NC342_03795 [Pseudoflavonifractor sp.]|nr:mannose-6-phosphate isomerase [Alloprevotella sp.]MCM1116637.1 hypothetical protein [Pseudoflavonifractor sp.]